MWAAAANRVPAIRLLLSSGADLKLASKVEDVAAGEKAARAALGVRNKKMAALRAAEQPARGAAAGGAGRDERHQRDGRDRCRHPHPRRLDEGRGEGGGNEGVEGGCQGLKGADKGDTKDGKADAKTNDKKSDKKDAAKDDKKDDDKKATSRRQAGRQAGDEGRRQGEGCRQGLRRRRQTIGRSARAPRTHAGRLGARRGRESLAFVRGSRGEERGTHAAPLRSTRRGTSRPSRRCSPPAPTSTR